MQQKVRSPAVSGLFYPSDATTLGRRIEEFLAVEVTAPSSPKAVIAPHAGYDYSGPTAGIAIAQLVPDADHIQRIVLLGPSHYVPLAGLAVSSASRARSKSPS